MLKGSSGYSVAQVNRAGSMEPNRAFASIADWNRHLASSRKGHIPAAYGKMVALGGTYVLYTMRQ
jgi:hypothetical protein